MICESCNGSGQRTGGYVCYGCAGTGKANPERVQLRCIKQLEKYNFEPGDRCTAWVTTPALITKEKRYLVRNWRIGRQYALLERQIKEYFVVIPNKKSGGD